MDFRISNLSLIDQDTVVQCPQTDEHRTPNHVRPSTQFYTDTTTFQLYI